MKKLLYILIALIAFNNPSIAQESKTEKENKSSKTKSKDDKEKKDKAKNHKEGKEHKDGDKDKNEPNKYGHKKDGRTKTGDPVDKEKKGPNGETIYKGERGGRYYLDSKGNKVYSK